MTADKQEDVNNVDEQRCETCRFWKSTKNKHVGTDLEFGACRRYAPRPTRKPNEGDDGAIEDGMNHSYWPETYWNDGCGEWEQRKSLSVIDKGA